MKKPRKGDLLFEVWAGTPRRPITGFDSLTNPLLAGQCPFTGKDFCSPSFEGPVPYRWWSFGPAAEVAKAFLGEVREVAMPA
jgi:hypothetical protein